MVEYWILQDRQPVPCDDIRVWGRWFDDPANRIVARDEFSGVIVSTVFLGIDHGVGGIEPILFETMIFGLPGEYEPQWRYSTWEQAVEGHGVAVEVARRLAGQEGAGS